MLGTDCHKPLRWFSHGLVPNIGLAKSGPSETPTQCGDERKLRGRCLTTE